jgi:hypothetical protein
MWQLDELDAIRNALEIPMDRLLLARRDLYGDEVWPDQGPYPGHKYKLPRLDSNQEPTDSPDAVVIDLFSGERVA